MVWRGCYLRRRPDRKVRGTLTRACEFVTRARVRDRVAESTDGRRGRGGVPVGSVHGARSGRAVCDDGVLPLIGSGSRRIRSACCSRVVLEEHEERLRLGLTGCAPSSTL